jgi:hypothetical protein
LSMTCRNAAEPAVRLPDIALKSTRSASVGPGSQHSYSFSTMECA